MVEISNIVDEDSLKDWLNTFSEDEEVRRKAAVDIAVRSALRVLPLAWQGFSSEDTRIGDLTALPVLLSNLLSSVTAKMPTDDNKAAIKTSHDAIGAVSKAVFTAERVATTLYDAHVRATKIAIHADAAYKPDASAIAAARAASDAKAVSRAALAAFEVARVVVTTTQVAKLAASAAVRAVSSDGRAADWSAIQTDCQRIAYGQSLEQFGLWPAGNPFEDIWIQIKTAHTAPGVDTENLGEGTYGTAPGGPWAFWLDWYEKELTGQPQDWDLLQAIVDQVDWDGSVEEVNGAIEAIANSPKGMRQEEIGNTLLRLDEAKQIYADLNKQQSERARVLRKKTEVAEGKIAQISEQIDDLSLKTATVEKEILDQSSAFKSEFEELKSDYKDKFDAALTAFTAEQAIKGPIELWKTKEDEHHAKMISANKMFVGGLIGVALLVIAIITFLIWDEVFLATVLTPVGCDPVNKPELCQGFSFRGMIISGSVLTLLTLSLWFTRLQMKEYLSERHLELDARERRAFAQAYIGLLGEGEEVTEEAKAQRALVYSALFRPSSTGIIKEEGGLDPSLTAALSKILTGK